jgi:hypothetical protein
MVVRGPFPRNLAEVVVVAEMVVELAALTDKVFQAEQH